MPRICHLTYSYRISTDNTKGYSYIRKCCLGAPEISPKNVSYLNLFTSQIGKQF